MNHVVAWVVTAVVTLIVFGAPLVLLAGCSITAPIPGTEAPTILPPPPAQPAVNSPRRLPPLNYDPGETISWRDVRRAAASVKSWDWGGEWTNDEVRAAGLFVALAGTDAGLSAAQIGPRSTCYEGDPIITSIAGRRPSSADFALAAVVGVGLGIGVAAILPPMWRDYFLSGLIGVEAYNVASWATNNCPWGATARPAAPAGTGPAFTDGPAGWAAHKPGVSAY